ncbi:MAG: SgcJ/EcaC family oxidoreductase [Gemmatimonadota bacterium]|nr:MAG: SgcJ/EcaC family oxidoreductase [Gemmatimonadota bacterium]
MAAALVAAGIVAACATGQPPPQDVTADIAAANDAFMAAFAAGDGAGLADLYTEDARLLPPGSDPVDGRPAIATFWQSVIDSGVAEARLMIDEVENFGDAAYEVSHYAMYDADGNVLGEGKYIVIWKRTDTGWKLHRDIWN